MYVTCSEGEASDDTSGTIVFGETANRFAKVNKPVATNIGIGLILEEVLRYNSIRPAGRG